MLAGMQRVEIRGAINAQDHRLAVDDKLLEPIFEGGFDNPRISLGRVVAVACKQPNTIAVA
jgi:hypothetical protein